MEMDRFYMMPYSSDSGDVVIWFPLSEKRKLGLLELLSRTPSIGRSVSQNTMAQSNSSNCGSYPWKLRFSGYPVYDEITQI
jgi:hypothetical protein